MKKVTILLGSEGMNHKLADIVMGELEAQGVVPEMINLLDLELPIYSSREEGKEIPAAAISLLASIKNSGGLMIVAPEYNGGMPPVMINAISWVSRAAEDWREAFDSKPVALATHSGSCGQYLMMAMRQQFSFMGANVLGKQLITSYQRMLDPEKLSELIAQLASQIPMSYDPIALLDQEEHTPHFEASY